MYRYMYLFIAEETAFECTCISNTICIHVHLKNRLLLVVLWMHLTVAYQPHVAPFFFMCNFHGNVNELGIEKGEVSLSVSIEGNPELYTPGKLYNGEYKPACLNAKFKDLDVQRVTQPFVQLFAKM